MAFDISKVGLTASADSGVFMAFIDPTTGLPALDDAGAAVGVTLRSRLSRAAQAKQRDISARRIEQARRGKDASVEQLESEGAELLAALTVSWTFTELDGAAFPATYDNALQFWADPRFRAFREQANGWVADAANFTTR